MPPDTTTPPTTTTLSVVTYEGATADEWATYADVTTSIALPSILFVLVVLLVLRVVHR